MPVRQHASARVVPVRGMPTMKIASAPVPVRGVRHHAGVGAADVVHRLGSLARSYWKVARSVDAAFDSSANERRVARSSVASAAPAAAGRSTAEAAQSATWLRSGVTAAAQVEGVPGLRISRHPVEVAFGIVNCR